MEMEVYTRAWVREMRWAMDAVTARATEGDSWASVVREWRKWRRGHVEVNATKQRRRMGKVWVLGLVLVVQVIVAVIVTIGFLAWWETRRRRRRSIEVEMDRRRRR